MVKHILSFMLVLGFAIGAYAQQGVLKGKVTDKNTGETIPFATIALEKGGAIVAAAQSDIDGNYTIKPIPPGSYDAKASYVGYSASKITGIKINADKTTYVDFTLASSTDLKEVVVTSYKTPLIDPDTKSGGVVDRQKFNSMATKNIASVAATTAGVYQADEGKGISVRGSRADATDYYVDGERVRGSASVPQQAVEQVSVITGGVPAQYGDNTGGVISITTRGPQGQFFGGVEAISSQVTDAYGYNFLGWSLGGPIVSSVDSASGIKRPILGYFLSGEVSTEKDPSPSAIGVWKVNDDTLKLLEQHPLVPNPSGSGAAKRAEFITKAGMEKIKARQNVRQNNFRLSGKIDFSPIKDFNITVGGNIDYTNNHNYVQNYSLFNTKNNPQEIEKTWRVYARVTQKLNLGSNDDKSSSIISNAYYTVQAGYQKYTDELQDENHKKNHFNYGYVGKFDIYRAPIYAPIFGNGGLTGLEMVGYQDTLVTFERSELNSITANYTSDYFDLINPTPSFLDQIVFQGGLRNGDRFASNNAYSIWNNVGRQYGGYSILEQTQFRTFANFSADIKKHAIMFGFEYEQRDDRGWGISATPLWTLMRNLVNTHITLDTAIDIYNTALSGSIPVIDHPFKADVSAQSNFDRALRTKLGLDPDGTDRINIDALDPNTYSLNMFTPDELLNTGFGIMGNYYGYSVYGERLNNRPSFDDFFNKKDNNNNFTREIGSFRPIYMAGFIQDKFDFRDIKFNVGLRIDRYDANQIGLKDIYSLYETKTVAQLKAEDASYIAPENLKDDYVAYVSDALNPSLTNIVGYRDPSTGAFPRWFNKDGLEVLDPSTLTSSGKLYPYLADPANSQNPTLDFNTKGFKDYAPQVNFMPRVAFSFPISDVANFFAHYDVLTQRPPGANRNDPFDYYSVMNTGGTPVLNNPGLLPERTTDYELGFAQILNDAKNSSLTISAFYRELRNMIQVTTLRNAYPIQYTTYSNIDFGTVKGFSAAYDLRRVGNVSMNVNYTLQFADGTGSDATSAGNLINSGIPNLRSAIPLDYDQRHNLVANFDFRYDEGAAYNGPVLFGKQIFSNAGFNLTARAGSGTPYSAQSNITPSNLIGVQGNSPQLLGTINGNRKPWNYRFDLRVDKNFKLSVGKADGDGERKQLNLNVYLQVLNLLNTKNVIDVYAATGNPLDDGFITSPLAEQTLANTVSQQSYIDLYSIKLANPANYSIPRRTRIGLSLDF